MSNLEIEFSDKDNQIIDQIGSDFSIEALTNTYAVLSKLSPQSYLIEQVREAIQRKTNAVMYAFHRTDELAQELEDGEYEGMVIYQKIGDRLDIVFDTIKKSEIVIKYLHKNNIHEVYTGNISSAPDGIFYGIEWRYYVEHNDFDNEVTTTRLDKDDIRELESVGIAVHTLAKLV